MNYHVIHIERYQPPGRKLKYRAWCATCQYESRPFTYIGQAEAAGYGHAAAKNGETRTMTPAQLAAGPIFPRIQPCPCACNSGGFCGGCGHAGCGGRR